MAGWLDGWMDGWLDGWLDGWMAGASPPLDNHIARALVSFLCNLFEGYPLRPCVSSTMSNRYLCYHYYQYSYYIYIYIYIHTYYKLHTHRHTHTCMHYTAGLFIAAIVIINIIPRGRARLRWTSAARVLLSSYFSKHVQLAIQFIQTYLQIVYLISYLSICISIQIPLCIYIYIYIYMHTNVSLGLSVWCAYIYIYIPITT